MATVVNLETLYKSFDQTLHPNRTELGHFTIFRIEDMVWSRLKPSSYSRRNYFKVSLLTGHSKIHYADQSIEIPESALIFTNPIIPYRWERIDEQPTGFVCVFTEAFFSRFGSIRAYPVFQSADNAVVPLTADQLELFRELFQKMAFELQGSYVYKYDLLRNLLLEVVHEAQKLQPALGSPFSASNAAERITGLFSELLERQFPIEFPHQTLLLKTPSAFAQHLHIHVNHLNKALRETTGQTTSHLISNRLYQEARVLLKSTNWTINEIAWSLGFEEPQHFSSFFKNRSGVKPSTFRQTEAD
ncbi:helix-turn-helix domain-containing protein [Larkinella insperata]|uniref:Helix-turn-helix domain-containing protein n=1 Tax=Larkinella insperata TaxID=332158 RepID=A0ABW3Q5Q5_9BACT|nr:AraC family transcriptional regulator [Larkinella insperata]